MALTPSSISEMCRQVASFLGDRLDSSANGIRVLLGSPAQAADVQANGMHKLNLFFYRFEPGSFGPAPDPDEIWRLRMHCLITPLSTAADSVSEGEGDLRLLGEVMRVFHETPILDEVDIGGEAVRLQVVPEILPLDDLNHLWSTQGSDARYRPSMAYEMALAPVIPSSPATGSQLVGTASVTAAADVPAAVDDASLNDQREADFPDAEVDTSVRAWAPRICFVVDGGLRQVLGFVLDDPDLAGYEATVWVAGEAGANVTLQWELWDQAEGWRTASSPVLDTTAIGPEIGAGYDLPATLATIALPFAEAADPDDSADPANNPRQAVLYATREYTPPGASAAVAVRSNPLLVTLYRESD